MKFHICIFAMHLISTVVGGYNIIKVCNSQDSIHNA